MAAPAEETRASDTQRAGKDAPDAASRAAHTPHSSLGCSGTGSESGVFQSTLSERTRVSPARECRHDESWMHAMLSLVARTQHHVWTSDARGRTAVPRLRILGTGGTLPGRDQCFPWVPAVAGPRSPSQHGAELSSAYGSTAHRSRLLGRVGAVRRTRRRWVHSHARALPTEGAVGIRKNKNGAVGASHLLRTKTQLAVDNHPETKTPVAFLRGPSFGRR